MTASALWHRTGRRTAPGRRLCAMLTACLVAAGVSAESGKPRHTEARAVSKTGAHKAGPVAGAHAEASGTNAQPHAVEPHATPTHAAQPHAAPTHASTATTITNGHGATTGTGTHGAGVVTRAHGPASHPVPAGTNGVPAVPPATNASPVAGAATNVPPAQGTNGIPLGSPTLSPSQRDAVFAWPAMPPARNAPGGTAIRLPAQRRILSPACPHGMRLVPGEAFETIPDAVTSTVRSTGFYMDALEVSRALWNSVVERGRDCGYADLPVASTNHDLTFHPVVHVTWYDCLKWCNARSEGDGLVPVYYTEVSHGSVYRTGIVQEVTLTVDGSANGYRLPTSLEWEAASRGGRRGCLYPWGNDFLGGAKANFWGSGDPFDNGTTPTGYYNSRQVITNGTGRIRNMANGYGLYDMAGNVAEWCWDRARPPPGAAPLGQAPAQRVVRGGSWRSRDESLLLCGYEGYAPPVFQADHLGFRSVRTR